MMKFWRWATNATAAQTPARILLLEGYIAEESWFEDDITPKQFKEELYANASEMPDDIRVQISSPGGDCFAAAKIYDMLKEYPGKVTVEIHALAASAASVIAMAGDEVLMSPTSCIMIHNPETLAMGEVSDLEAAIGLLGEVKESILNAYAIKTGMPRTKLAHMMDAETWMSARKAVELGFADGILYEGSEPQAENATGGFLFDRVTVTNSLLHKMPRKLIAERIITDDFQLLPLSKSIPIDQLEKRLSLLRH
jgi:ATP-dependent Clp protease, protease subunit